MITIYYTDDVKVTVSPGVLAEKISDATLKDKFELLQGLFCDWEDSRAIADKMSNSMNKYHKKQKEISETCNPADQPFHNELAEMFKKKAEAWKQLSEAYK